MAANRPFWELAQMDQGGIRAGGLNPASMLNPASPAGALPPEEVAGVMEPAAVAASNEPPPVGSKLRQMWEAYQSDPDKRAAALAAGAALLQPTPPGQSHAGMVGQAIMLGAQTLEQRRATAKKEELAREELGIRRESVDVHRKSVEEQAKQRGEDRAARADEGRRNRRQDASMRLSNEAIQKELQTMRGDQALALEAARQKAGTYEASHPVSSLIDIRTGVKYENNKDFYDAEAVKRGMTGPGAGRKVAEDEVGDAILFNAKTDKDREKIEAYKLRLALTRDWNSPEIVKIFGGATEEEQAQLNQAMAELEVEARRLGLPSPAGSGLATQATPDPDVEVPTPPPARDPNSESALDLLLNDNTKRSEYVSPEIREVSGGSYQRVYAHKLPPKLDDYTKRVAPKGHVLVWDRNTGAVGYLPLGEWNGTAAKPE